MATKFVQAKRALLQSAIDSVETQCVVTEFVDLAGNPIVQADIGDFGVATIEPNTTREEIVTFTIDSNVEGVATLTLTRGMLGKAPYTTGGPAFAHDANVELVMSNNPELLNQLAAKGNDETITGSWRFPATPTLDQNPLTKIYFDQQAVKLTGNQTLAGIKTFSSPPVVPDATAANHPFTKGQFDTQFAAEAVRLTGDQTIAGIKTFSSSPVIPDAVNANQPFTKGQFDAAVAGAASTASPSVLGLVFLDAVADDPVNPKVITATEPRAQFMSAITGMIIAYAGPSAPPGFLICDGSAVSRTTYADLFAVIGTAYGAGDGSTTFNVPDLVGRTVIGAGQGALDIAFTITSAEVSTAENKLTLPNARDLQYGDAVALTFGAGTPMGTNAFFTAFADVDSSGWIDGATRVGNKILCVVNDGVAFSVGSFYYVVETRNNNGTDQFRVSTTPGGSVTGTSNSGRMSYAVVPTDNTEGSSGNVTFDGTNTLGVGNNTMPTVGDKLLIVAESSSSLSQGTIVTVTATGSTTFTVSGAGTGNSGSNAWVNVGDGNIPYDAGTYYVFPSSETEIQLADSQANAFASNILNIQNTGDADITITKTDSFTNRSIGEKGGVETHNLAPSQIPEHTHDAPAGQDSYQTRAAGQGSSDNGSGGDGEVSSTITGGVTGDDNNQPHNNMQPFAVLNYIIKS